MSFIARLVFTVFISSTAHAGVWDSIHYICKDEAGNELSIFYRYDYSAVLPRDIDFNGERLPKVSGAGLEGGFAVYAGEGYTLTFSEGEVVTADILGAPYTLKCERNWWATVFSW